MKVSINLLPQKARFKFAKFKKIKQLKVAVMSLGTIFFLFTAFVLFFDIRFREENIKLKSRVQAAEKRIEDKKEMELQIFLLKERLEAIDKILEARKNISQVLWEMFSLLPAGAKINNVEANEQTIKVVFTVPTHSEASDFIDNFPREKVENLGGKNIKLNNVSKDTKIEGYYQVNFEISF